MWTLSLEARGRKPILVKKKGAFFNIARGK